MARTIAMTVRPAEDTAGPPTLEEIRTWPATVSVPTGCRAYGISRSYGYELARTGQFPARTVKVGGRYRVVTASIIADLTKVGGGDAA